MADLVKMKATTTFHNAHIRIGEAVGGTVSDGVEFETDPNHAKDLARLGHAHPVSGGIHDIPDAPLEAHHQVSEIALRADRARRQADAAEMELPAGTEASTGAVDAGRRRARA